MGSVKTPWRDGGYHQRIGGEYEENTMRIRREYEGNTKTGPNPLPSIWLADALRLALLWLSPPWRLTDPAGMEFEAFINVLEYHQCQARGQLEARGRRIRTLDGLCLKC